ncbi:MAG: PIN domain nuclease [Deltaproteobacteria bacterium]|nr:PIN domain nuclease [Deltaproteobacteria bacterium]
MSGETKSVLNSIGILPDTSAWIDFFRGNNSKAANFLTESIQSDSSIFITGLIVTEILRGCTNERQSLKVLSSLRAFPFIEPIYPKTYIDAASLYRTARTKGLTIRSTVDCIIAALAIEHNIAVLHSDRDYKAIAKISKLQEV